jgi:hypothetical protein
MLNPQTINQVISPVAFGVGEITVDAEFVASGLGLSSEALKRLMRSGLVVAQFELGVGDDRGRYRLVFRYRHRTWWIIVAGDGAVVESFPPLSEVRISPDSITVKPRGKTHKRSDSSPNVGGPKEAVQ